MPLLKLLMINKLDDLQIACNACTLCDISKERKNAVMSNLTVRRDIMIIGEAPGANEDEDGEPFTGLAGQLMFRALEPFGLNRADVHLANVLKCRPTKNRLPTPEEIENCRPFLEKQIELVAPKLIITVGATASEAIFKHKVAITKFHGTMEEVNGRMVMATFHPAFLLRQPSYNNDFWNDLIKGLDYLGIKPIAKV